MYVRNFIFILFSYSLVPFFPRNSNGTIFYVCIRRGIADFKKVLLSPNVQFFTRRIITCTLCNTLSACALFIISIVIKNVKNKLRLHIHFNFLLRYVYIVRTEVCFLPCLSLPVV